MTGIIIGSVLFCKIWLSSNYIDNFMIIDKVKAKVLHIDKSQKKALLLYDLKTSKAIKAASDSSGVREVIQLKTYDKNGVYDCSLKE